MCIAIVKPLNSHITKEILETCSKANKDGCGMAYIEDGTLYIKKFMKFDDFYNEYVLHESTSPMLIHFRIATHGKVEINNCHPFKLNNRMALIHNGIISGYGDKETKTDTQDFIDKVIGNISWKMWKNDSFRELVDKAIGYSKLCVLDITGKYYIVGEEKGDWVDGVWYSNSSWKPKTTTYQFPIKSSVNVSKEPTKVWDMYGEQTYDEWWDETHSGDKYMTVIYKCKDCGREMRLSEEYDQPEECEVCKGKRIEEIGWVYNGEDYLYEDEKKLVK